MSLFNRFKRAVRARAGHVAATSFRERFDSTASMEDDPAPPLAETPRAFAVGDRVVVQHDGVCEIVAQRSLDFDGWPVPVFVVRSRQGERLIPEPKARALMRHVVSREGAGLARRLLFAPEPTDTPLEALERAWLQLDLGPEAQGLRALYARKDRLSPRERALFESVRTVVCDELDRVDGLPEGTTAARLRSAFGDLPPV